MMNIAPQPAIEIPQIQPKEKSQAYLEALEASKRIAASKNFVDAFSCSNSNDSISYEPSMANNNEGSSNSRKLYTHQTEVKNCGFYLFGSLGDLFAMQTYAYFCGFFF